MNQFTKFDLCTSFCSSVTRYPIARKFNKLTLWLLGPHFVYKMSYNVLSGTLNRTITISIKQPSIFKMFTAYGAPCAPYFTCLNTFTAIGATLCFLLCACTLPVTIIKNKALKVKTHYVSSYKNGVGYTVNVGQILAEIDFIKESLCTQV